MISFRLPLPGVKRGGGERVAHDLAQGLAHRGHEVTVWSADPKPDGAAYEVARIPGTRLINHWLGFRLVSGYLGNLLVLLPNYSAPDVLFAHGDSLLLPLLGIPLLRVMHGSALDESLTARSPLRKLMQFGVYLQEKITARTQRTIAISHNTQARYPSIQEIIANGVDTSRFFPRPVDKEAVPTILFVGTLGGRKRGSLLLNWFEDVIRPAIPSAQLWMVSESGPASPGVRYFPGAPEHEIATLYRAAWVLAAPSVYEGFGLPYLEAMASGTPVIATDNPGSREVLENGRYGKLIADDAHFPGALVTLLSNHRERESWISGGLIRSQELSISRAIERYEAVLFSLTPGSHAHGASA